MGALSAKKAIFKIDISGSKVSVGEIKSCSYEEKTNTVDVSILNSDWKEFLLGQSGWTASMELFYDPTDVAQAALIGRITNNMPCEVEIFPFGEDEVYDLDLGGATGGTFTLGDGDSQVTSALAYNATAVQIQTALNTAYGESGIIVTGTVITFPTGLAATLTLDATSLTGATDPAVVMRDPLVKRVGSGFVDTHTVNGAIEDAIGMSISVQGNGELELNPA